MKFAKLPHLTPLDQCRFCGITPFHSSKVILQVRHSNFSEITLQIRLFGLDLYTNSGKHTSLVIQSCLEKHVIFAISLNVSNKNAGNN